MKISALALAAALLSASVAQASTVITVDSMADIFAAGLGSAPASTGGGGILPPSFGVFGGEAITISAVGSINPCVGACNDNGPDGAGGSTSITNSTGSTISGYTGPSNFNLVGVYTGVGGDPGLNQVFTVGSTFSGVAPSGATLLYLGIPDALGFNDPSGYYSDNGGSFTVTVSGGVPEPTTWALALAGMGGTGFALRRRRQGLLTA